MECHIRSRISEMIEELAQEHQRELAAAGTLVDLEELTCQIGDEFARQLCERELANRGRQIAEAEQYECPECGLLCPRGQPEPVVLQGIRGKSALISRVIIAGTVAGLFFPLAAGWVFGAEHGYPQGFTEDGLGGQQS